MTIKLPEVIKVTNTGIELVGGKKYYAYHSHGQFEITIEEKCEIDWFLQVEGRYNLDLADYLNMPCEKIHYEAFKL